MSTVRIPADPFPFVHHRTLAEVARTEELLAAPHRVAASEKLMEELRRLLHKARRHNPPRARDDAA